MEWWLESLGNGAEGMMKAASYKVHDRRLYGAWLAIEGASYAADDCHKLNSAQSAQSSTLPCAVSLLAECLTLCS